MNRTEKAWRKLSRRLWGLENMEMMEVFLDPKNREVIIDFYITSDTDDADDTVYLANGQKSAKYLVEDLRDFGVRTWPGAILSRAIPGIVSRVLNRFKKGKR